MRDLLVPGVGVTPQGEYVSAWLTLRTTGTPAVTLGEHNIASWVDNAVGDFTINWLSPFANATYAVAGASWQTTPQLWGLNCFFASGATFTAGSVRIALSGAVNSSPTDCDYSATIAVGHPRTGLGVGDMRGGVSSDDLIGFWAHVTYSGGTPSMQDGFNISSLTDNAVGDTTFNLVNALNSTNYPVAGMAQEYGTTTTAPSVAHDTTSARTTTAFRTQIGEYFDGQADATHCVIGFTYG